MEQPEGDANRSLVLFRPVSPAEAIIETLSCPFTSIDTQLETNNPSLVRIGTQVESLSKNVSEMKTRLDTQSNPATESAKDIDIIKKILIQIQECHSSCKTNNQGKSCSSLEEIVQGVCNSIVGETYYKWTCISKYYPSVVFLFVEEGVSYPKRSQIKTRLTFLDASQSPSYLDVSRLQGRIRSLIYALHYVSGSFRCNCL
jgi:hypothetical protein